MTRTLPLLFELTGVVADLDETTPGEPGHPALVVALECGDDFARIVVPTDVWLTDSRALLAVDRPLAVAGESDVDPF